MLTNMFGLHFTSLVRKEKHDPLLCDSIFRMPKGDSEAGRKSETRSEAEVDVRFITEPISIRPAGRVMMAVPYDLVDNSEGGAVDALIKSIQAEEGE